MGSVIYTEFTTSDFSQMSIVSGFILSQTDRSHFSGTQMMVAEWENVPLYDESTVSSVNL